MTWNELQHDRAIDGRFVEMVGTAPEGSLAAPPPEDVTHCSTHDRPLIDARCPACARADAEATWGTLALREGSRTPWGPAQTVTNVAPGIAEVSCAGHGGVKLSPARNREVHPALRNSSGWYEEDCEWAIPAATFPAEWVRHRNPHGTQEGVFSDERTLADTAWASVRTWQPDEYEKATGKQVLPGESAVRDEALFRDAHRHDFISAGASPAETDPDLLVVAARRSADGARTEFLVPRDQFASRGQHGFVIDPARHPELPQKPVHDEPELQRHTAVPVYGPRAHGLRSDAANERVSRDMRRRWRLEGGEVLTLHELIERDGVTEKDARVEGGKRIYGLCQQLPGRAGASTWLPVSKATFDAMGNVPDRRSTAQIASQDASIARASIDSGRTSYRSGRERLARLEERADALRREEAAAEADARRSRELARRQAQEARERAATVARSAPNAEVTER